MITLKNEFHRQAGPREMYGCVVLRALNSTDFRFEEKATWGKDIDSSRYIKAIKRGVIRGLQGSLTGKPRGIFCLIGVQFSEHSDANVPIAFEEAAREAVEEIVSRGLFE